MLQGRDLTSGGDKAEEFDEDEFEEFDEEISEEPVAVAEAPAEETPEISEDEFDEFDEELSEEEFDEFEDF